MPCPEGIYRVYQELRHVLRRYGAVASRIVTSARAMGQAHTDALRAGESFRKKGFNPISEIPAPGFRQR